MRELKVLFVSSEVAPFAKTGGLADVSAILPRALTALGCKVSVLLPYYLQTKTQDLGIKLFKVKMATKLGNANLTFSLYHLKKEGVDFYFINKNDYYDREFLYGTPKADYPDNALRFAFLASAALTSAKTLNLKPDIIHLNDWQTALIPFYLEYTLRDDPFFRNIRTVFTIHNLAYQGLFGREIMPGIGIDDSFFTPGRLEFYGKFSFMKAGILYSDAITTVSKGYAREILDKEFGCGLEGLLNINRHKLYGILNGADYNEWNPKTDRFIKVRYDERTLKNKAVCKQDLLAQMELPLCPTTPLLGVVTRLAEQKGIDIIADSAEEIVKLGCNLIILGAGSEYYHNLLTKLAQRHPKNIAVKIAFDNSLAHKIEAGSDMFLMPSRYEPCGLNQMYSLKYGTIPVVRAVGGLDDSIVDYTQDRKSSNGFKFNQAAKSDFIDALKRAISVYQNKNEWRRLVLRAMGYDFSWKKSVKEYIRIYNLISQQNTIAPTLKEQRRPDTKTIAERI